MRTTLFSLLAVILAGAGAFAQSSNHVPGPTDYASFSRFITDRNIFDPNRQPHYSSSQPRTVTHPHPHSASAPAFSLVGTMSYDKGIFAFFNGNSEALRKALEVSGKIADYTVTAIDYGHATLESTNQPQNTNQPQKLELKVGDVVRQENGQWDLAGPGDLVVGTNATESTAGPGPDGSGSSAPASAGAASDILKRLMEKREQENK